MARNSTAVSIATSASLRLCDVERPLKGSCGFHLSRTQWDPYPWVSGVEEGSSAEAAGLTPGDCVLEVNGADVLGEKISQVADRVREKKHVVSLLVWNAGSSPCTTNNNLVNTGPTPLSLQRLSSCLQSVFQLLECPVCLDAVSPPAAQCCNGHVLCPRCRSRADKCPVCRVTLGPRGRCLLADKLHVLLTGTFASAAELGKPPTRPFRQLKSRLDLPKASSVENMTSFHRTSPIRARSLSTGQISANNSLDKSKHVPESLFNCPYGFECSAIVPSRNLMSHLQEHHDGPIIQYYLKSTPTLICLPPLKSQSLISLTSQEQDVFYLKVMDNTHVWLWMVGDASQARRRRFKVNTNNGKTQEGGVFSLTTPWHEVVRNARCLKVDVTTENEMTVEICAVESSKALQ